MPEKEHKEKHTVSRLLGLEISKEQELQQIVELAARICGSPIAMITFIDEETQHIKFRTGTNICEVPLQQSICQHTLMEEKLLVIPDTRMDDRVMNNPFVAGEPGLRFYAGSPLTTHDELNIGTLCVFDLEPKTLDSVQVKMLNRLSRQVTRLLEFEISLSLLKGQYASSRAEETQLRSFFESSSSCHLLLNEDFRVISFNKALADVMTNIYQLPIFEGVNVLDYVHPAFADEFTKNYYRALAGETISVESTVNSPNGDDICWYITYEPAYDAEGAIIGVSYSATDISQLTQHRKTVIRQVESFRQIEQILSNELQQPLNAAHDAMVGLKKQGYPDHLTEFHLLDQAFQELAEKAQVVLSGSPAQTLLNTENEV